MVMLLESRKNSSQMPKKSGNNFSDSLMMVMGEREWVAMADDVEEKTDMRQMKQILKK